MIFLSLGPGSDNVIIIQILWKKKINLNTFSESGIDREFRPLCAPDSLNLTGYNNLTPTLNYTKHTHTQREAFTCIVKVGQKFNFSN